MKRLKKPLSLLLLCSLFFALITSCGNRNGGAVSEAEIDPHEGEIQVTDSNGDLIWIKEYETVPVSALQAEDFTSDGNYLTYTGTDYNVMRGIDVSSHQGDIDWQQVAADGVQFVMLRVGYRGWSVGKILPDERFAEYYVGAKNAGLQVGVYFFSQALTEAEALEEASFVLEHIDGLKIDLPVVFDWENIEEDATARTANMDPEILTDCCLAFCEAVKKAGYSPSVYLYKRIAYYEYELDRIAEYPFWVAEVSTKPSFYYAYDMWQYSFTGKVAGITGDVDLNLRFEKKADTTGVAQ